jgi:hypothetical protein
LGVSGSAADEPAHDYVGVGKCKSCHGKELYGDQVSSWRKGPHAKAFETLASEKSLEYARERGIGGSPQQADDCVKCHVTAHGVAAKRIKYELDSADGVQCESCHAPGADYRKRSVMSDRDKSIAAGLVIPDEALCTSCHNLESPAWDPERYSLADGSRTGFDYEQAKQQIAHPTPEGVRGRIAEIEKELRENKKKRRQ